MVRSMGSEGHGLCLNLGFMMCWLCYLEQVTLPLCVSVFLLKIGVTVVPASKGCHGNEMKWPH